MIQINRGRDLDQSHFVDFSVDLFCCMPLWAVHMASAHHAVPPNDHTRSLARHLTYRTPVAPGIWHC